MTNLRLVLLATSALTAMQLASTPILAQTSPLVVAQAPGQAQDDKSKQPPPKGAPPAAAPETGPLVVDPAVRAYVLSNKIPTLVIAHQEEAHRLFSPAAFVVATATSSYRIMTPAEELRAWRVTAPEIAVNVGAAAARPTMLSKAS